MIDGTRHITLMNRTARAGAFVLATVIALCGGSVVRAAAPAGNRASLADVAEKADWALVRTMLDEKRDANAAQADGMTALHWAAHHDDVDAAKRLLAAGARAKCENHYGVTPLALACTNGDAELVRALLEAGADANATLRGGETALMTASRTGRVGAVQALLDAGAKVDAADRKGQTALMWAAADGHAEVVELLVRRGADVHARLQSGFTPFLFAVREGHREVVRVLLKAGIDANETLETGKSKGRRAPTGGTSALVLATENGHFELALDLLKAGADPNDQRCGLTPLHMLASVRKPNRGDGEDGMPPPTGSGKLTSLEFARELVAHGADVNRRLEKEDRGEGKLNTAGATAFLLAAKTADLPFMRLLVELGADPLLPNKDGCTPLMAAAGYGTLAPDEEAGTEDEACAAVEYLLTLGADVNTTDHNGETAMHGAAYKSLPKMVRLLAAKGAKVDVWNHKNKYGWTPITIAEGFRPGNFKPSVETIAALHDVMRAAGVTPPPPTTRPTDKPRDYPAK
jgi:ankyrin repeat protein